MLLKSFLLEMYYLGKCQFFFFNWVTLIFRDKLFHSVVYTALVGGRVLWESLMQDCRRDLENKGGSYFMTFLKSKN